MSNLNVSFTKLQKRKNFVVTGVTNKINLSNHRFEIKKIFKPLLKEKIKHIKFHQFFNYCTHNKIEIKVYPKIRVKANLEEVSFE